MERINIGSGANTGTGDSLHAAGPKLTANLFESLRNAPFLPLPMETPGLNVLLGPGYTWNPDARTLTEIGGIIRADLTAGNATLANVSSVEGLATGMVAYAEGISANTTITVSGTTVTLSVAPTISNTAWPVVICQKSGAIAAAASGKTRIDLLGYDSVTGVLSYTTGTETTGTPTAPALPAGKLPAAYIKVGHTTTSITKAEIIRDKRMIGGYGRFPLPVAAILHSQIITSTGDFVIPAGATVNTEFRFRAFGGGAGGGGVGTASGATAGGGCSGSDIIGQFKGFAAGDHVTCTIGVLGAGGVAGNNNGSSGADTVVTYAAVDVITSKGGSGGIASISASYNADGGGPSGGSSCSAGASGLTLTYSNISFVGGLYRHGGVGIGGVMSGRGGDGPYGGGGPSIMSAGPGVDALSLSAGGGGAYRGGSDQAGGDGKAGAVIVEWVL